MFNFAGLSATRKSLAHSRFRTIARLTASCLICLPGVISAIGDDTVTEALQVYGLGQVNSVAFSPDGSEVLVGAAANAMLYDRATGQLLRSFTGHTGQVNSVAFSSDGSVIAAGSSDMTTRIWSISNGQLLHVLTGHTGSVNSVAFSPVANRIATASSDHTWKLWNAATGSLIRTFIGHTNIVSGIAFSPDGTSVVSGSYDSSARLWDVASGGLIQVFPHFCHSVAFSPDGTQILTGGDGSTAKLWDAFDGTFIRSFSSGNTSSVSVAFSQDGTMIVTTYMICCWNYGAIVYERDTGAYVTSMLGHTSWPTSVAISPDGLNVVTGSSDYTVRIWNAQTGAALRTIGGHQTGLTSAVISPDGTKVLTGSADNTPRIWNLATGNQIRTLTGHTSSVNSVKFSPDGGRALTGSTDNTAKLWNVGNGALVRTFGGHTASVNSVAFNGDGTRILTGSSDLTARLRNANTGALIQVFSGYYFNSVGVLPDGARVYTGNADNGSRIWDVATGAILLNLQGGGHWTAASIDGTRVLAAYAYWVFVWDASTGTMLQQIEAHPYPYSTTAAAFSLDGLRLITGGNDNLVKLWNVSDRTLLRTFKGHTSNISSLAFSPDGAKVLTASYDGTARLWDVGDVPAPPPDQPAPGGDVPATVVTLDHLWQWDDGVGRFVEPPNNQVSLDPTKPTYLLTHGWDAGLNGDMCSAPEYAMSSIACAIRHAKPDANIIAWDWKAGADPNSACDFPDAISDNLLALMKSPYTTIFDITRDLSSLLARVVYDARQAGANARTEGNKLGAALAAQIQTHGALGSELHLIGHSHGGGLLGRAAAEMSRVGYAPDSLTTLDTPRWFWIPYSGYFVDSLRYVDPNSVRAGGRVAVFHYHGALSGFGGDLAGTSSSLTNVALNPAHVPFFTSAHSWIHGPDDLVCPTNAGWLPPTIWTPGVDHPQPVQFNSSPPLESALSVLQFPGGCYAEQELYHFIGGSCQQPFRDDDSDTPGLVLLSSDGFDTASTWTGNLAQLVTNADPLNLANRVMLLDEQGDASLFKDINWPVNSLEITFQYMFRPPRGSESLTVYLDGQPVFYDNAETTLATNQLTSSGAIFVGGAAGTTARLNFVLRTDGYYGGQVLIDNIRIFGAPCDPCDLNCDGSVNQFDIQPFIATIATHSGCSTCAGDADGNGTANTFDINGFIECLAP